MMNTELAKSVDSKSKLENFLRYHKQLVSQGYFKQDIEFVCVDDFFKIKWVKFVPLATLKKEKE